jgi:WD40-like Beta Propeller Repeat
MKISGLLRVLAMAALLAAACGAVNPPVAAKPTASTLGATPVASGYPSPAATNSPTPSATSHPTPRATPTAPLLGHCPAIQASTPANRNLALVSLRGSDGYIVRDITDITHPKAISNLGIGISPPSFVSAAAIAYGAEAGLVCVPLIGSPETTVVNKQAFIDSFAWSPDGDSVVYLTATASGGTAHQLSGGHDRVLAGTLKPGPAVGCETQFCSLTDSADFGLSYSPDGTTISLVDSVLSVSTFRLWSSGGKVLNNSDSKSRSMSAWSGDSFYFGGNGVEVWRAGVTSSFLPGVSWIRPKASPAGGQIVYATRDAQGWHHTFVVDIATKQVRELKKGRSQPAFLTSRYVWYKGERSCVAADQCPPGWGVVASGKTYIYDLQTGTETESVITQIFDVWPHPA